jgi:two-component system response regulator AtoC
MADIILVEDESVLRRTLARALAGYGHDVRAAESAEEGLEMLAQGTPDLVLTDQRLPGMTGHDLLLRVKAEFPGVAVVVLTAHGTIEDAVAAMRDGASDYLRKPVDLDELRLVVDRCLRGQALEKELSYHRSRALADGGIDGIIGRSAAVELLRGMIRRVAALEKRGGVGPTVLLQGETGTGKGLVARAIHKASARAASPLIEVNCTAIPEDLLEAELMGYERGAFTDAKAAKPGLLEAAEDGTIFFDEIGHMSPKLQAKLLKVIEERTVRRLGSTRDRATRCSIITATHMDLESMVARGEFREDLYHRINVVKVTLPPLRERGDDVVELAEFFLDMHTTDYGQKRPAMGVDAREALLAHRWPGNIRELSHTIERAIVLGTDDVLDAAALGMSAPARPAPAPGTVGTEAPARNGGDGAAVAVSADKVKVDFSAGPVSMERIEEVLMRSALEASGGSKAEAGRLLGISRDTFRYRWAKYEGGDVD